MIRFLAASLLAAWMAATPALAQAPAPVPATPRPAAPSAPVAAKPAPVVVPKPAAVLAVDAKRIDVNSATASDLASLPGVGPVRSKAIVDNRPYDSVDALVAKKALPAGVLAGIRGQVALANINTSSARDMQRTLPGIGDVRAGQIVSGRPYAAPGDLVGKGVLTQALFDKVKDLISF